MSENKQNNLLARIASDEKEDSIQTAEAESALREEQVLRESRDKTHSLLSPKRKENQEVQKDEYISPFSDEFLLQSEKRDQDYEKEVEEENAVSSNRVQAFLMLAAALYVVALIVGYYNTPYSDGVPQIVTEAGIDSRKYLSEASEYIDYIHTKHAESVEAVESYTADLMSASELSNQMKKSNEAIEKKSQEVAEMSVPPGCELLHDGIKELYSAQTSMNSAAINYAAHKSENTFVVVDNTNLKFEERSEDVLATYDESFQK